MSEEGPTVFSGRYQLLRQLARGGMADVYLARDVSLDRQVALKVLIAEYADDPNFVERFRREAKAAANLNHHNIVGVHDWGQEHGTHYLVMEYVEGRTIADVLRSSGPLHPDRAAEIAFDVAGALACAHEAGLVHRDIKLGNIMVANDGVVKVSDFGIATALAHRDDHTLTQVGSVMGTATYFSPEQARGMTLDGRSDLYSLGVVLYEMIVGKPPFVADTATAVALKHVQELPAEPARDGVVVAPSLKAMIMKLLAKDPNLRYPKATDLRGDLKRYLSGRHNLAGETAAGTGGTAGTGVAESGADEPVVETPATLATPSDPVSPTPAGTPLGASSGTPPVGTVPPGQVPDQVPPGTPPGQVPPGQVPQGQVPGTPPGYPPQYYYEAPRRRDDWKRTALMLVALAALITVLGFLVVRFYEELGIGDSSDDTGNSSAVSLVTIPDIYGLNMVDAEVRLREAGLNATFEYRINPDVGENTAFSQAPPAGQRVESGAVVTVTMGQSQIPQIPPVTGRNAANARQILEEAGYVIIEITEPNQAEAGIVVRQDPPSRSELQRGEAVTIYVSTGPGQVFVPDVRNLTVIEAFRKLTDSGFRVGETSEASDTVPEGLVIDTQPVVGSPVDNGSEVIVVVSSGVPVVEVPDVVGLLFDTARLTLEREGLELGLITFDPVEVGSPDRGRVLAQTPPQGMELERGSEINLIVGELEVPTPTVTDGF